MIGWITGLGTTRLLIALVVVLFGAATLFYYQAGAARATAAKFKAENVILQDSLTASRIKHQSLALEVIASREAEKKTQDAVDEIQRDYLKQLEISADLDAENETLADKVRNAERAAGRERDTFDTRGVR